MSLVTQAWLENTTARRCVLMKVSPLAYDGVTWNTVTYYMSNTGYITADSSVIYEALLRAGIKFTESFSDSAEINASYGDVEIHNPNGQYDSWLDDEKFVWVNTPIQLYYGDPTWVCENVTQVETDFQLIFNGVVSDILSRDREVINLVAHDKMQNLNAPITEERLGDYGVWADGNTNKDELKPLVFGEIHNITPLLIDPATLEYMFNNGNSEGVAEIRDNGVPIYTAGTTVLGATINTSAGTFKLAHPPAGQVTMSVQGTKNSIDLATGALVPGVYKNNIANIIALIVTKYGRSYSRLTYEDIDLPQFAQFEKDNKQAVGIIALENGVINVCQDLAHSIRAGLAFTRTGKLRILKYGAPTKVQFPFRITDKDILHHSLNISNKSTVTASTRIGYARNWTVQPDLVTGIPTAHKDMFATEWFTETRTDTEIKDRFKLNEEITQKDTYLITEADAQLEAFLLNDFYKHVKMTYSFTGTTRLMSLELGQMVILQHNRFGLEWGKLGQVVGLEPDWSSGLVGVSVLIIGPAPIVGYSRDYTIPFTGFSRGESVTAKISWIELDDAEGALIVDVSAVNVEPPGLVSSISFVNIEGNELVARVSGITIEAGITGNSTGRFAVEGTALGVPTVIISVVSVEIPIIGNSGRYFNVTGSAAGITKPEVRISNVLVQVPFRGTSTARITARAESTGLSTVVPLMFDIAALSIEIPLVGTSTHRITARSISEGLSPITPLMFDIAALSIEIPLVGTSTQSFKVRGSATGLSPVTPLMFDISNLMIDIPLTGTSTTTFRMTGNAGSKVRTLLVTAISSISIDYEEVSPVVETAKPKTTSKRKRGKK